MSVIVSIYSGGCEHIFLISGSRMLVQNAALFVSKCRVYQDYSELQLLPLGTFGILKIFLEF